MSLVSASFYLFVIVSLLLYYIIPHKFQWCVLLAASIAFYCFVGTPWTIIYPLFSVFITWGCALKIKECNDCSKQKSAKKWLIIGLISNIGVLAVLKYSGFVLMSTENVIAVVSGKHVSLSLNLLASLGISFYTLQIVGYLADCYWGIAEPQRNPGKLALFTMFFPQMVSGPISRYNQLSDQLFEQHSFSWSNIRSGIIRIIIGTFKKLVLAENIAQIIPYFLDKDAGRTGPVAFFGMIGYIIQIYVDFDGCMDIVIGTARCFGITMTENFNFPFSSRTIQEFWQRWHITLGLWLRDYVMYPILRSGKWSRLTKRCKKKLGKNAAKKIPTHIAMLILWLCMGLWHGGWWNYIMEGIWFWSVIVIGEWCSPLFQKITSEFNTENIVWIWFQRLRTTLIYAVGAIMFKFVSVKDCLKMLRNIFSPLWITDLQTVKRAIISFINNYGWSNIYFMGSLLAFSFALFILESVLKKKGKGLDTLLKGKPILFQIMCICVIVYLILIFGVYGPGYNAADFIYGGF